MKITGSMSLWRITWWAFSAMMGSMGREGSMDILNAVFVERTSGVSGISREEELEVEGRRVSWSIFTRLRIICSEESGSGEGEGDW